MPDSRQVDDNTQHITPVVSGQSHDDQTVFYPLFSLAQVLQYVPSNFPRATPFLPYPDNPEPIHLPQVYPVNIVFLLSHGLHNRHVP